MTTRADGWTAQLLRIGIMVSVGAIALGGCVGDDPRMPPMGNTDTRMPVVLDYDAHETLHPVRHYPNGRVDPVDQRVGRHRDFGVEPSTRPKSADQSALPDDPAFPPGRPLTAKQASTRLFSAGPAKTQMLDFRSLRTSFPPDADMYLALAKTRKAKTSVVNVEAAKPENAFDATDEDGVRTADNTGVESRDGGYRLNFEDAEIKDVLQAVLGRVLGLSYTIAPNVTGRITISSSAAQNRDELLETLETVLAMQGLSLTESGSMYRVTPLSVGGGSLDTSGSAAGFGISVVPLHYSSVASMNKLLNGFIVDADGIRIDTSRNTIIVRGPGPRRAEIVRAIKALDGDWMHSQSVSMFELKRSHPEEIIQELTRIFANNKDGGSEGVIEFKAMKRLRSIMVIAKNAGLIRRAGEWIRRLDHQDTSATSSIFIYRPRYRDARELTKLVNGLFGQSDNSAPGASFGSLSSTQGSRSGSGGSAQGSSNGLSSASYAGGLSSGGQGNSSSGSSAGSGTAGNSSGSSFGSISGGGNGLKGDLADPVEAGDRRDGDGEKLKLSADTSNNTVVAYTDGETYAKVKSILRQLDIPPLQVAVNVIIAEVQLNDELKYGVQFFLNQSAKSVGSVGFSTSSTNAISSATQGAVAGVAQVLSPSSGFNFISGGASSPNVIISALDSISKVHILSTPSIVVMENKAATLEVGNQVPITTQQAQSNLTADAPTVNSVTYLDTGIILKIIPRVGQDGVVDMQIDQEISSVVPDATGSTTGSLTPTISKRRIASDISVRSGQNVLLAGLVSDTRSKSNGQVPFVGAQLGNILGNTDNIFSRTELVMFIRPVIIRHGQDSADVTDEFKRGLNDIDLHPSPVYKP